MKLGITTTVPVEIIYAAGKGCGKFKAGVFIRVRRGSGAGGSRVLFVRRAAVGGRAGGSAVEGCCAGHGVPRPGRAVAAEGVAGVPHA